MFQSSSRQTFSEIWVCHILAGTNLFEKGLRAALVVLEE